ncbi:MAG: polysaccharide biosynthesis protein [Ruminococcus sp.]|nr:polysaccharide biosynthesis protein [Ruminococcus sp.]
MKTVLQKFKYRKILLAVADAFIVTISALISNSILSAMEAGIGHRMIFANTFVSVIACLLGLAFFGAYNRLWRYFNKKDYLSCIFGVLFGTVCSCAVNYMILERVTLGYSALHTLIAVIGVCAFRFIFKSTFIDLIDTGRNEARYKRTMMVGGGQVCSALISEVRAAREHPDEKGRESAIFDPVCIIDADRSRIGQTIEDVQIVGDTSEIKRFAKEMKIEQIVFCIPSFLENDRKRILDMCSETNLPVKVIPFIGDLVSDSGHNVLGAIRDIKVEDLLGRDPVSFNNDEVRSFISGKTCMVTGGGGSIGSELVRQIAKYAPKRIIIIDICENYAYDIQQELIMDYGDSLDLVVRIASVRDYDRIDKIFAEFKPDIVFHAAAHKHVPLMEESPMEAIKNNVVGTFNTATIAKLHGTKKFVMISTDKAVNPTNVMGASKRCCEMIVQYLAQQEGCGTEFVTTRFGNVLGSNGSVIPKFRKQIEQGKPVTVTHPDIIRYFMTIPEAVSLVMEAAAIAHGGEIFVLDMGKPVRIVTLAENLIRMYGKVPYEDVPIVFTGLRKGEKIKEELLMNEEGLEKTQNKLIFIGRQSDIEPDSFIAELGRLREAADENDDAAAISALRRMVPTFVEPEEYNSRFIADAVSD